MAGKMTGKQAAFVRALVQGHGVPSAAAACGIAERTAWRWWALPEIRVEVRRGHADAMELASARLSAGMGIAVKVLLDVMQDDKMPPNVRLRAASDWIGHCLRVYEMVDLEQRIAALELAAQRSGNAAT